MSDLLRLPIYGGGGAVHVVVESPRIPSTRGPDGDPVDAMVLSEAPTWPGVVLACRVLGALAATQKGTSGGRVRNDRLLVVPVNAPRTDGVVDARQLHERIRRELEQFFLAAVALTDKEVQLQGWEGPEAAMGLVQRAGAMVKSDG
jgi:inorganic pyrophosphatase